MNIIYSVTLSDRVKLLHLCLYYTELPSVGPFHASCDEIHSVMEVAVFVGLSLMFMGTAHTCTTQTSFVFREENFPNVGMYCPTPSLLSSKIPLHHCKLYCIHSSQCIALNYNESDGTCTELLTPCVQTDNDPTMLYIMFNKREQRHCFTWIWRKRLLAKDTRLMYTTLGDVKVARIVYQAGFYPAYLSANGARCYTGTGTQTLSSRNNNCEVLVLSPNCTAAWVPYEAGQPIPTGAETAGPTMDGEATYTVMFAPNGNPDKYRIGYYTVANGYGTITYSNAHHYATTMKMLVLLWWGIRPTCCTWEIRSLEQIPRFWLKYRSNNNNTSEEICDLFVNLLNC